MRVATLVTVGSALLRAQSPHDIVDVLVRQVIARLGGDGALICRVDRQAGELRAVTFEGFAPSSVAAFSPLPLDANLPLCRAARTGEEVWVSTAADRASDFPELAEQLPPVATASLPVILPDGDAVVFGFRFGGEHRFERAEKDYLRVVVIMAAQALTRLTSSKGERLNHVDLDRSGEAELRSRLLDELSEAQRLARLGSWRWMTANEAIVWSPEMFRIFGIDPQASGVTFKQALAERRHPADGQSMTQARDRALRDHQPFTVRQRINHPDLGVRHILIRGEVMQDAEGEVIGLHGTAQDVTEEAQVREELTLRDERDRVAADLHDLTIQRLFALGMSLSSRAARAPHVADVVQPAIDDLDDIIRELRTVIFGLRREAGSTDLRGSVIDLATESRRALGFLPTVHFTGPVESVTSEILTSEVLGVVREALSNVARHARAEAASIEVAVNGSDLEVTVSDNGIGPVHAASSDRSEGYGLRNMRQRATRLGGTLHVETRPGGGTLVRWTAPYAEAPGGVLDPRETPAAG